jgi:rhodanese-related sulfurtransferase
VTIKDLKDAIDSDQDMVILDVRESNEYNVAHIPDAVNVPRGLLEFAIWAVVPDRKEKIFVYCKTGARAALATKMLNELGYKNAVAVDTGGVAWAKAGYPVRTSITDEEIIIIPAKQ